MRIEQTVLARVLHDEQYTRKVLPFIKSDYFTEPSEKVLAEEIINFFDKYNAIPNNEILSIQLANRSDLTEAEHKDTQTYLGELSVYENTNLEWLISETEKFCRDKAVYNAILESINILDGNDKKRNKDAIPSLLSDALAISFDNSVGHDYLENAAERWEYYHADGGNRIPFSVEIFNKITKGGMKQKTLNCICSGTGIGKSIFMCDASAHALSLGFNVLYITMEMPAEDISHRIDANILNITMEDVSSIDKKLFLGKIDGIKNKTNGKLFVKEYPTGVHAGHFRALIAELKQKKNFKADLIVIDYLGICGSQRLKNGTNINTNTYLKSVSEELRDLGKEENVPVLTGHQVNRSGQDNSDIDLTNVADSIGITNTLDLFFAVMAPEELVAMGQYLVKQLKNRYSDINYYKKFVIGIDKSRMKFFDVEPDNKYITDSGHKDGDIIDVNPSSKSFDNFEY